MIRLSVLSISLLILFSAQLMGQFKLYESTHAGGVVTGGYSLAINSSGSGSFSVSIPAGSTIRRAYLIGCEIGPAPALTVTLNGTPYTFNAGNVTTSGFNSMYGGASAVHTIDITGAISPATTNYTISTGVTGAVSNKYVEFYLYIAFDNPSLPVMSTAIWLNTVSFAANMPWALTTASPISTSTPVAMAAVGGYAANSSTDCEQVYVNGTLLGDWRGGDFNSTTGYGAMGAFGYYSNTIFAYGDDNANQSISGADVLSNIAAVIPNNTTSPTVTFQHCPGGSDQDNHAWVVVLAWGGGVVLDGKPLSLAGERLPNGSVNVLGTFECGGSGISCALERSEDGMAFQEVAAPEAMDETRLLQDKAWVDANAPAGPLWYRARMIDADGHYQYSSPAEVAPAESGTWLLKAWPNPLAEGSEYQVTLYGAGTMQVRVYEAGSGKLVTQQQIALDGEQVHEITIPTQDWGRGLRLVEMLLDGKREARMIRIE